MKSADLIRESAVLSTNDLCRNMGVEPVFSDKEKLRSEWLAAQSRLAADPSNKHLSDEERDKREAYLKEVRK